MLWKIGVGKCLIEGVVVVTFKLRWFEAGRVFFNFRFYLVMKDTKDLDF